MERNEYDLVIIGSGPGGQKAAIQAGKLGKNVLVIDENTKLGGICLHDGTIPSKSFREAILHLSGYKERSHYGRAYRVKDQITMEDLTNRTNGIVTTIEQTIRSQLTRNNIECVAGRASIISPNQVKFTAKNKEQIVTADKIIIATGTRPFQPKGFDFDGKIILDSDSILHMKKIPRSLSIVGGGVIGCEYGTMFATLGVKVTIVEARSHLLAFVDRELVDTLTYKLREQKTLVITDDKVVRCAKSPDGRAVTYLESGKRIVTDVLLISAGRQGNVWGLGLENLGIEVSDRGIISVNSNYQTTVPNIYAVGDVIGAPALAATAIEQGRAAACHAFDLRDHSPKLPIPYGIYTIPEIAMVGRTEAELSKEKIPYEVGISRFSEVERGKIVGEDSGVLKLLFHRGTLQILGVHVIGDNAAELVHIGQAIMCFEGGIETLAHMVFNYPTLSQAYKTAALDGLNKVIAAAGLPDEDPYSVFDETVTNIDAAKKAISALR